MNSNKPKNKQTKKKIIKRKARVKGRKLPNNRKRRTNIIRGRKIAAASAKNFTKRFNILRQNGNSVRVTGRDLIYSIPDDLTAPIQDTNVITVIPANPAYWKGTRIAALASGYQNYRPILFKITYIPMCAVTQQGNVIGGTIWDDGIDNANIQQSLRTSNGGFMTQCYVPHTTQIRPKSNLQFNLYRMGGDFTTTSNPFLFIAIAVGCKNQNDQRIIPGYFYITWSFELKNPIGSVNTYNNSGLIKYEDIKDEMNTTMVNLNTDSNIPFGAYINVEEEEGQLVPYYNETPIEVLGTTPTWVFTSVTKTSTSKNITKTPIEYSGVTTTTIRFGTSGYCGYIKANDNDYEIYLFPQNKMNQDYRLSQEDTVFLISDRNQIFGIYANYTNEYLDLYQNDEKIASEYISFQIFIASKEEFYIQLVNLKKIANKLEKIKILEKISALTQEQPNKEDATTTIINSTSEQ